MPKLCLDVDEIGWSHDCIKHRFRRNKKTIFQTLYDLLYGRTKLSNFPEIHVVKGEEKYYVVSGNRRLWVFKQYKKYLKALRLNIFVSLKKDGPHFNDKFTTQNDGSSVRIVANNGSIRTFTPEPHLSRKKSAKKFFRIARSDLGLDVQ